MYVGDWGNYHRENPRVNISNHTRPPVHLSVEIIYRDSKHCRPMNYQEPLYEL